MRGKLGPSEIFKRQTPAEVLCEEQEINEIMDKGLPQPPTNPSHFYVDSLDVEIELDVEGVQDEDIEVHMESPRNIATFLRMPQKEIPRATTRVEPLIDYSQSQILTSDGHVDNLHTIQQRKDQLAQEKEVKRIEKELTKSARAKEKQQLKVAREQRAHERQAKKTLSTPKILATQEEAKKLYKSKWTIAACEEFGQKLHDLIKQGGMASNSSLYLGRQPLVCKRNQQIAICELKAKRIRKEKGTHLLTFDPSMVLPHFHGVCESLLEQSVPPHFVRPFELRPWLFCTLPLSVVVGVPY